MDTKKDRKAILQVRDVASTMAIENMYVSNEFMEKMIRVAKGELSSESVRQEIINKYARQ